VFSCTYFNYHWIDTSAAYKHDIVGSLVMKRGKTLNSFLVLVLRLRFVNVNYKKNNKTVFGA
jgi:hypothetical protein